MVIIDSSHFAASRRRARCAFSLRSFPTACLSLAHLSPVRPQIQPTVSQTTPPPLVGLSPPHPSSESGPGVYVPKETCAAVLGQELSRRKVESLSSLSVLVRSMLRLFHVFRYHLWLSALNTTRSGECTAPLPTPRVEKTTWGSSGRGPTARSIPST